MSETVYVLGCGPAGLLAAHAVALAGHDPVILSKKEPSIIGGAQYLHSAIPGIAEESEHMTVEFVKRGDVRGYADKVYGDQNMATSWDIYDAGEHRVWNMRQAYSRLWRMYEPKILNWNISPTYVEYLALSHLVISTIPKHSTVKDRFQYDWKQQPVWIRYGEQVPTEAGPMEIVMSGSHEDPWYRQSNLFGWRGIEFPRETEDTVRILKPISTNCPGVDGVLYLGRYGEWKKGVLVHEVFHRAATFLGEAL